jgi:CDP-glycerol glycerophosphotransferase (TagB/SpsB family)
MDESNIFVTGCPRFDHYDKICVSNPQIDFLICPANTPFFNKDQEHLFTKALNDTLEVLVGKKYLIEVRLGKSLWNLVASEYHQFLNDSSDRKNAEFSIANAKAVIATPSTIVLEAMILNKPVGILNYGDIPYYAKTPWKLTNKEQVENAITELIAPPQHKMDQQELQREQLILSNSTASVGIINIIQDLLNRYHREDI